MANAMTVLVILLVTMTVVTYGQMVQYSRGWRGGKRADLGAFGGVGGLPSEFKMNFPAQGAIRRTNAPDTIHCGLRKLRMLLRGNTNDQLYHLPCELLNILPREVEGNQHVQHENSHHLDLYDDNNNNNNNNNYDDNN
ncbi:pro-corazonin [Diachasma alloeum]|uniref:pro-corazonin n=1 Tax=Diachasma alloeum TaxID=454923 RepID=UPI0007382577|nr:pro-corazonin [Diachasma alloeum]